MTRPSVHTPFRLVVAATLMAVTLPRLVTEGMFLDGVIYAVIARNMGAGLGTFWKPMLTPTMTPDFFGEHPALAISMQSVFFRVFGDHLWVESLYSFLAAVATAVMIVKIWRRVTRDAADLPEMSWLPVLLWCTIPLVSWSYSNNMLENTQSVFALGAVYLLLGAVGETRSALWPIAGAALCLMGGLFSKGVVSLYPFAFFPAAWLLFRTPTLKQTIARTALLVGLVVAMFGAILLYEPAREMLSRYRDVQFLASLRGDRGAVPNRMTIAMKVLTEMAPAAGVALVIYIVAAWRRRHTAPEPYDVHDARSAVRHGGVFVMLAACGSLPLIVSPRQSAFYMLPALPVYAIGVALFVAPFARRLLRGADVRRGGWRVFRWTAAAGVAAVIVYAASIAGEVWRDRDAIGDVKTIGSTVGEGTTIGVCSSLARNWGLHAYFARYYRVALDPDANAHEYVLADAESCPELERGGSHTGAIGDEFAGDTGAGEDQDGYERVPLDTRTLVLLRRR